MKLTTHIGLLALTLCTVSVPSLVWAAPGDATETAEPAKTALKITRDNFVSFSWRRTGGFAGISTLADLQGNVLSYSGPRRGAENANAPQVRGLSNKQVDELVDKLIQSNFTAHVGNYRQQGLMDGFNDVAVLTLSDEDNMDRQFIVQDYGGKAPKEFQDFMAYFREIVSRKFSATPAPLTAMTPQ